MAPKNDIKFAPQGNEISVAGAGRIQLGRAQEFQQTGPIAQDGRAIPAPQTKGFMSGQGAGPKGTVIPMQGQPQQSASFAPRLGQPQMAQSAPPQHGLGDNEEVHTFVAVGVAPDGRRYEAVYEGVFPRGTKILGVKEK